jgi:hypothetical protein
MHGTASGTPARWLTPLLIPFICLAFLGLIVALVVHVCGIAGLYQPTPEVMMTLAIGVFVVSFPAGMVQSFLIRAVDQEDIFRAVDRGCPTWMRRLYTASGFYAILNFIAILIGGRLGLGADTSPFIGGAVFGFMPPFYAGAGAGRPAGGRPPSTWRAWPPATPSTASCCSPTGPA